MHSVIASAVRAQFLDDLYDICQGFIREITIEMQKSRFQNDAVKKELIQFSWSLNNIFHGQFQSESDGDFLWALAEIYRDIGYYERALPLLKSLVPLYTHLYGEDCIQLGSVWNSQGMIEYELSHFDTAMDAYQKSHAVLETHLNLDQISSYWKVEFAKLDLNIGEVYMKTDYVQADSYFEQAYQMFFEELGKEDYFTQNALAHKGMFLAHAGRLEEAENIFLDIYNRVPQDTCDRDMRFLRAEAAHHLGSMYSESEPLRAMSFLESARDTFWNFLSPTHPDTLDVLNTICSLRLSWSGDYPSLLTEFNQLLELFIKAYGSDDPNVGTVYNNIGLCYYYMGSMDEAIRNYREAIRIIALAYGEDHESVAYIYNNIGAVYSESGNPEKAIPEHEHALRIYKTVYPDGRNLDLAQSYTDLSDALFRSTDYKKAMEYLNEAFTIYNEMLSENARQFLQPYTLLGNIFAAVGDYENAVVSYSHVICLMLENGYAKDSDTVQEFAVRIEEIRQMKVSQLHLKKAESPRYSSVSGSTSWSIPQK